MKELIVFTNMGQTFMFKGVTNFTNTTTGFKFDYHGVMTESSKCSSPFSAASTTDRSATFNNTCVAGYALKDMED